jgi:hypothetical protein
MLSLALLMSASEREALSRAVERIRHRTGAEAGDIVQFQVWVADQLLAYENLFELTLTPTDRQALGLPDFGEPILNERSISVLRWWWEPQLYQALSDERKWKLDYLEHHLLPLLYAWQDQLAAAGHSDHERYQAALQAESVLGELDLERIVMIDNNGMIGAQKLFDNRGRESSGLLSTDRTLSSRAGVDAHNWIDIYEKHIAAFALLDVQFGLVHEVALHPSEHRGWRRAVKQATTVSPILRQNSLLAALLTVAGRDGTTASDLAEMHGGAITSWQARLQTLFDQGVITSARSDSFIAVEWLRTPWREANPRLRYGVRTNLGMLPVSGARREQLMLLTMSQLPNDADAGVRQGVDALLELLAAADRMAMTSLAHCSGYAGGALSAITSLRG